jgi:tRNA (guanine37-N1)-methyltransferase
MIGEVILDKNPSIRTVINKAETLGSANIYRALEFEVIAGEHDFLVETKETGSTFRFDYSKVFWNSRLSTEHHRLVELFKPGEMVCDVMAGVGPFAVPAGKKGVFVWANDLNPDCYGSLEDAIKLNKVYHTCPVQ